MHIVQHTLKIAMESSIRVEKSFKKKIQSACGHFSFKNSSKLILTHSKLVQNCEHIGKPEFFLIRLYFLK